jgi:hypothetical protein
MPTRMSTELTERRTPIVRAIILKAHKRLLVLGIVMLALCLIAPASAFAQGEASPAADPDFAAIDAYIQEEMREVHIPGLALSIVHDDEVVHLESFGEADPPGEPLPRRRPSSSPRCPSPSPPLRSCSSPRRARWISTRP